MDEGTLIMCGLKPERVLEAVAVTVSARHVDGQRLRPVPDYEADTCRRKSSGSS